MSCDLTDLDDSLPGSDSISSEVDAKESAAVSELTSQLQNGEFPSISSIETLLLNIQGLLKVAMENARRQERQLTYEKSNYKLYRATSPGTRVY